MSKLFYGLMLLMTLGCAAVDMSPPPTYKQIEFDCICFEPKTTMYA